MEKDDNGGNSRSHNAIIRCAKAALLLSSLKSHSQMQEIEMMKETIDDLKKEIITKSFKRKKSKLCDLLEFAIQIVLLFSLLTFFFFLFALNFR